MKTSYEWAGQKIEGEAKDARVLLSAGNGTFCSLAAAPESKYNGFFISDGIETYRILEHIGVIGNEIQEIAHRFFLAQRRGSIAKEDLFVPHKRDAFCYSIDGKKDIYLSLDAKKAYDNRQWGRAYNISAKKGLVLVEFTKESDEREDKTYREKEYSLCIAIAHDGEFTQKEEWHERYYGRDAARREEASRWVFSPGTISAQNIVVSASKNKETAAKEAQQCLRYMDRFKAEKARHLLQFPHRTLEEFAAHTAIDALRAGENYYAGLPWFFQFWSRDTLISSQELPEREKIWKESLRHIQADGRLPNRVPASGLACADSVGWLFFRLHEQYHKGKLSASLEKQAREAIAKSIDGLKKSHISNSLAYNGKNETWMDTEFRDSGRFGAAIEVQALLLAQYKFAGELVNNIKYLEAEANLKSAVRKLFWDGTRLKDTVDDLTQRPNVFIAYYVYPELLTHDEWVKCFETALFELWLDWGALASIAKSHQNFIAEDTGADISSYHHGNSWYWVNNLAALCMARLDRERFKPYIEKILEASLRDLFWQGALGAQSEVSSASHQTAGGCENQLWSNAMLLELLEELR